MTSPLTHLDEFAAVPAELIPALRGRGFEALTSVQCAVLEGELAGRDLRISSQTGSGKTVAIGLVLARELLTAADRGRPNQRAGGPMVLILTPTRELAAQVGAELRWLYAGVRGVRVDVVTGGTPPEPERRMLARGTSVLVGTPGRILDHLRSGALQVDRLAHVVLDEADQMFDLGFRDELDAIVAELPEKRCSHLVSATFPRAVSQLADRFQRNPVVLEGTRLGAAHEDIEHIAHRVAGRDLYSGLVNLLLTMPGELTLVFVRRRIDASELAERLTADGIAAAPFSGELAQTHRTRTLNAFRSRSIEVLVSTDVAARGIDVPELSVVVHVALPEDSANYTHRSGRTGRAGRKGRSVLLVPPSQQRRIERILNTANVQCSWRPLPAAKAIRRLQAERAQRELEAGLAALPAPAPQQLEFAQRILDGDSPLLAVAALAQLATPKPARAPIELRATAAPKDSSRPSTQDSFVRFRISYGKRAGATPDRVLAHICRRGRLDRRSIGAIRIDFASSTVEIASKVADAFEANTRSPDSRDAGVKILRQRPAHPNGFSNSRVDTKRPRDQRHPRKDTKGSAKRGSEPARRPVRAKSRHDPR